MHQISFNVLLPLWSTVLSLSTPILVEYYILYLHFMLHTSFCSLSLFFITFITKAVGITRRISTIYLSLRRKLGSCSTTLLFGFLQQQKTSPAAFAIGEVMLKYVVSGHHYYTKCIRRISDDPPRQSMLYWCREKRLSTHSA